jgi:prolipoprotein diacylglyceryltransferase
MQPNLIGLLGVGLIFLIFIAIAIFFTVFWILMLIDAVKRKMDDGEKVAWIIILVFLQVLGAIIYYFVVKTKDKS